MISKTYRIQHLEMVNYLKANESEYSVENRQCLFQCGVNNIQARTNRPWQHEESHFISCKYIYIYIKKQESIYCSAKY